MSRKYAFSSPAIVYPSPTSPGVEPCLWEDARATEVGFYGPPGASDGHLSSSAVVQYMPSPREESAATAASFKTRADPQELVGMCSCLDRLGLIQKQLYNLDLDFTMWSFNSTVDLVTTSLSSCHIFLNCVACPKDAGNLPLMLSLLDHTFNVLNQLLFHRTNRNSPGSWDGQQYNSPIPYDYALALQDCILEQAVSTSFQIVISLREIAENEIANHGSHLDHINDGISSSDFSSPASGIERPAREQYNFKGLIIPEGGQPDFNQTPFQQRMHDFECAPIKPSGWLSSEDVNHFIEVIRRYETIIGDLQALVAHNASSAAAVAQPVLAPASWSISNVSDASATGNGLYHFQPQQQQHRKFSSYDVVGLS
ncbi:hypothetical protein UA08_01628 [Talaromyces atroroseus]|uniref:Uncharacterized protein n=1 Tax=Talaromyces atroroseus TaxID=1441469 RepID=A0A1Q5QAZ7_TALAT|nr:hypothetical protein UA08_01628 [Talaromyces atroroseus]OKL63127.1 hypothetical protein UA08_01628 [Talaromyces atroroseus]